MSEKQKVLNRLNELGLSPKRSLGQNFLIDENIISKIVSAVDGHNSIIEVGPGLGALTESLILLKSPSLDLIELDKSFAEIWRSQGLNVFEVDALKFNWTENFLQGPYSLVSNLPYQISSSLVIERSIGVENISEMILMFQKEVAQRIQSEPREKSYGLLTVVAQSFWTIHKVCEAGPKCFYPPPNVASRVLKFQRSSALVGLETESNRAKYLNFLKMAFAQRRKLLVKNLGSIGQSNRGEIENLLVQLGHSEKVRAEELTPDDFYHLFMQIYKKEF